jgi:hypothetical protein
LDNRLQGSKKQDTKVEPESMIGHKPWIIPKTRKLVTLVLSLETGLVSPQYHVQYDNFYETVRPSAGNERTFSQWQYIAGLKQRQQWNQSIPSEGANI